MGWARSALAVGSDKGRLYSCRDAEGVDAAPACRRVGSASSFVEAAEALGYPDRPVCFKRPVASGKRGFRVLDGRSDRLDRLLHEKPDSSVTTLEDVLPVLEGADSFPQLVVMEHLPGAEYSVDVLAKGDAVGPVVPRVRERTRAGISFRGTVEENEALIEAAGAICRRLGLEYNVNLQFKYDAGGTPKVIEINPRISGTIVMCVGAGANLPYLGLKHALGEPLPPVEVEWGTSMTRYWQEVFYPPDGDPYHLADSESAGTDEAAPAVDPPSQP
jgi:carbamoyl-phosphate synthase large subunit